MNSTLNFGIPTVLVFQLEVYYKVDRLLTGLTAQQKGTTARWHSNKTSLHLLIFNLDKYIIKKKDLDALPPQSISLFIVCKSLSLGRSLSIQSGVPSLFNTSTEMTAFSEAPPVTKITKILGVADQLRILIV